MLLLLNTNECHFFLENVFENNSKIVKDLLTILKISKSYKKRKIFQIYCNLFFDEYKEMFFNNNMDELFILNNEKFTKLNIEGLDIYPRDFYKKILNIILIWISHMKNILMKNILILKTKKRV